MPPLTDPQIVALILQALSNWRVTGYVMWNTLPRDWIKTTFPTFTTTDVSQLMYDFVRKGGVVDQIKETRPEWNCRDYHYDFRLAICGRNVYLETVLIDDDPTDPVLQVVSAHDV